MVSLSTSTLDQAPAEPPPGRSWSAPAIGVLAAEIAAALDEPAATFGGRIQSALFGAVADPDLLSLEQRRPKSNCYARHVLHSDAGGRFTILAIVWVVGQFSPAHGHHTWCGYAVLENALEETLYRYDAEASQCEILGTELRRPGYSCFAAAGLDQIHRLGNAGGHPAISIHVYGVERQRIATHVNRLVDVTRCSRDEP
jgi:predicted metal-dependent enzyme (double-stranded beta helix superfamily)